MEYKLIDGTESDISFLTEIDTADFDKFKELFGEKFDDMKGKIFVNKLDNGEYILTCYFLYAFLFDINWAPPMFLIFNNDKNFKSFYKMDNEKGDEFESLYNKFMYGCYNYFEGKK